MEAQGVELAPDHQATGQKRVPQPSVCPGGPVCVARGWLPAPTDAAASGWPAGTQNPSPREDTAKEVLGNRDY